jgi:hypothetical protein
MDNTITENRPGESYEILEVKKDRYVVKPHAYNNDRYYDKALEEAPVYEVAKSKVLQRNEFDSSVTRFSRVASTSMEELLNSAPDLEALFKKYDVYNGYRSHEIEDVATLDRDDFVRMLMSKYNQLFTMKKAEFLEPDKSGKSCINPLKSIITAFVRHQIKMNPGDSVEDIATMAMDNFQDTVLYRYDAYQRDSSYINYPTGDKPIWGIREIVAKEMASKNKPGSNKSNKGNAPKAEKKPALVVNGVNYDSKLKSMSEKEMENYAEGLGLDVKALQIKYKKGSNIYRMRLTMAVKSELRREK